MEEDVYHREKNEWRYQTIAKTTMAMLQAAAAMCRIKKLTISTQRQLAESVKNVAAPPAGRWRTPAGGGECRMRATRRAALRAALRASRATKAMLQAAAAKCLEKLAVSMQRQIAESVKNEAAPQAGRWRTPAGGG